MKHAANVMLFGTFLAAGGLGIGASPSLGEPPRRELTGDTATGPAWSLATFSLRARLPAKSAPRAVEVARATTIPACTLFVDAASSGSGDGTARKPHKTIAAAVAAADPGAVICVAEGTYAENLSPGEKYFTLAGGFQRGKDFKVRDSAAYVTKATGRGGSFIRIEDPGPKGSQLTAIDGFDISGYSQAIYRQVYYSQRFDITNNHIHDNKCADATLVGAGFSLANVSGRIQGNVIRNNSCGRGGAGALNDETKENTVTIEGNVIDGNSGTEPDTSHGGGLYLFATTLKITANLFTRNTVTSWGAGLYIGSNMGSGQKTTATLNWNVYRSNKAGIAGGGLFCDDSATCLSYHEIYDRNCGSNIFLDSGPGTEPTIARFDHLTNVGALDVACKEPGAGVQIERANDAPDTYSFVNAIFWGNAPGRDFVASCDSACGKVKVSVSYSLVQTKYPDGGIKIAFGDGNLAPADPLFAAAEKGDFHLRSAAGRWTPTGHVKDTATSPAIGKGYPRGSAEENPERAGGRNELGAYGNSGEASFIR